MGDTEDNYVSRTQGLVTLGLDALNSSRLSEAEMHFRKAIEYPKSATYDSVLAGVYAKIAAMCRAASASACDELDMVFMLDYARCDASGHLAELVQTTAQLLLAEDALEQAEMSDFEELMEDFALRSEGHGPNVKNGVVHYMRGQLALRRGEQQEATEHFRRPLQPSFEHKSVAGATCRELSAAKNIIGILCSVGRTEALESVQKRQARSFCSMCESARPVLDLLEIRANPRDTDASVRDFVIDLARDFNATDVGVALDPWRFCAARALILLGEENIAAELWEHYLWRSGRKGWNASLLASDLQLARLRQAVGAQPQDDELGSFEEEFVESANCTADVAVIRRLADAAAQTLRQLQPVAEQHDRRLRTSHHSDVVDERIQRVEELHRQR